MSALFRDGSCKSVVDAAGGRVGIWIGLSSGLAVVAALLLARWLRRDRLAPPLVFEH
ncbi:MULTISPECIES: hypothetical protein [Mesorhizobium]|uniref:hypothetical protein n=1 Tax=Mesorhizobium TaxID=68287 RepID=UPI00145A028E|nr:MULTISPECIES: hypothetical protein [Mesorhizobium]